MLPSSVDDDPSSAQVRNVHENVKFATGGLSTGGAPMVRILVMEFVLPPLSVTVSVTVRVPVCGYVALTVFPVAVGLGNRPRSQLYETIVPSSVDGDASSWHVSVGQLHVNAATGGLSTGGGANDAKSSLFGDPVPATLTLPLPATPRRAAATAAAVAVGCVSRYSAATPATCGEAIEVPLSTAVCVSLPLYADVMPAPGAKISRHAPKLENEARASAVVVAPTVSAVGTRAGDELHASALLLPAATA